MKVETPRNHFYMSANTLQLALLRKVELWINENCKGAYVLETRRYWTDNVAYVRFHYDTDAVMFKLALPLI